MNIFMLHNDPVQAAKYQVDKHIVKMPLETAQMLCTVFSPGVAPYKRTHYNHPCSVWVRSHKSNYMWLITHGLALCEEYTRRYNKTHACQKIIEWCKDNVTDDMFTNDVNYQFCCVPDECKDSESIVNSYRNYYIKHKQHIAKWSKVEMPAWYSLT